MLRRLPHNVEAEMAVIGSAFVFGEQAMERIGNLAPQHFITEYHRAIWAACLDMFDRGSVPDPVTLRTWASEEPTLEGKGIEYLTKLADCAVPPASAEAYAQAIIDDARKREIIELADIISSHAYNGKRSDDVVRDALNAFLLLKPVNRDATELYEMSKLSKLTIPQMDHIVTDLVPEVGLTLLAAKPKVGKSWMLLDIALACAGGGFALGELRCKKAPGLFLMLEDSPRRLKDRINKVCAPAGVPAGATAVFEWSRGSDGIRSLECYLDNHPETKIIGIDVLAAFRPIRSQQPGYTEDYQDVKALQELAHTRQIATILVHHLRKAESDDAIDLVSGTLGVVGAADHIIVITGNKENGHKLTSRGRDIPDKSWDIAYSDGKWTILGDSAPKVKPGSLNAVDRIEMRNAIREMLAQGKGQKEIARTLKCSPGLVNKIAKEMAQKGASE